MFEKFRQKTKPQRKVTALVAAAGIGKRMRTDTPKQFLLLDDKPILAHTLEQFSHCDTVTEITVVTRAEDILLVNDLVREFEIQKVTDILPGGETRQESVFLGLEQLDDNSIVLIHDGARPFITSEQIEALIIAVEKKGAAALGTPVKDTLKQTDANLSITATIPRENLYRMQTPQAFFTHEIKQAHSRARESGLTVTDDCALMEQYGRTVTIIESSDINIKITTPEDLWLAEAIYNRISEEEYRENRSWL